MALKIAREWAWVRRNLLATPLDVVLTLAIVALFVRVVPPLLHWAILDATWSGDGRAACQAAADAGHTGACWVFVRSRLMAFIYGFYPDDQRWRVNVAFLVLVAGLFPLFVRRYPWKSVHLPLAVVGIPVIGYVLLSGGMLGLPEVETTQWGGLMLTLILALVGMACALPIGILLALGRRSSMPVIQKLCVLFIELWRGVPLVTVLFMASVMLPLFLPQGTQLNKLLRALVGMTLFDAAYMAEVVRGGLQAIPKGQYEAAQALGLSYWRMQRLVILPQALRSVIPGIVNTFIGLFKDTTLVLVIGMFDLLGMVQTSLTDPEWLGYSMEGYVFVGLMFWIFCFGMSRYSQRLERTLSQGVVR
jgi:general L-amino acid transport system permease protein